MSGHVTGSITAQLLADYPEVTDRPWIGPCATTGLTVEQFAERMASSKAPRWAKRAAVSVCRSYGIKGLADPAYIANVIAASIEGSDSNDFIDERARTRR